MFTSLYKGFQSVDLWGHSHKMDILQQKKKFSLISFNDHMKQYHQKEVTRVTTTSDMQFEGVRLVNSNTYFILQAPLFTLHD